MGTTLAHGIYLPSEGERNCYAGLKVNWETLDQKVADISALQSAIAGALHREIVASLPTTDIDTATIYMILNGTSATENIYDEYMYISNAWELIGTSATDLTNYYTKAEVDGKLLLKASASDLTSHTGDTTIHVTASDKAKWNTVALIKQLRLVNTQVGSATTIAFANIDDTNGIKVGDKCMDLDGKMFEITAVDTANQTVTVGSALIDLALDANVMHLSGNETAAGQKTFNDLQIIGYGTQYKGARNAYILPEFSAGYSGLSITTLSFSQTLKIGSFVLDSNNKPTLDTSKAYIQVATGESNSVNTCVLEPRKSTNSLLGTSSNKWTTINGLTPSSLSLPSNTWYVDISSYFTNTGDGQTNSYTTSANGWIYLNVTAKTLIMQIRDSNNNVVYADMCNRSNDGTIYMTIPIGSGNTLLTQWFTSSSVTITTARFIPCQGNV